MHVALEEGLSGGEELARCVRRWSWFVVVVCGWWFVVDREREKERGKGEKGTVFFSPGGCGLPPSRHDDEDEDEKEKNE